MSLLLRPRLHEIHHWAVPGEAEETEDAGREKGNAALPPTCLVTSSNDWLSNGRAEGHSPAGMDGEILSHVSHQLWGPVGPDALGGPGLGRPGQPLVPDLRKQRPWNSPGERPPPSQQGPEIHVYLVPLLPNPETNPLDSLGNWGSEKAHDFKVNGKSTSEPRYTPRSLAPSLMSLPPHWTSSLGLCCEQSPGVLIQEFSAVPRSGRAQGDEKITNFIIS